MKDGAPINKHTLMRLIKFRVLRRSNDIFFIFNVSLIRLY